MHLSHVWPCGVLQSCADVTFWSELSNRKLDQYKLSETPIDIHGEVHARIHDHMRRTGCFTSSGLPSVSCSTPSPAHPPIMACLDSLMLSPSLVPFQFLTYSNLCKQDKVAASTYRRIHCLLKVHA
jgi:hypothetical protein